MKWKKVIDLVFYATLLYYNLPIAFLFLSIKIAPINFYLKQDIFLSISIIILSTNLSIIPIIWFFFNFILQRGLNLAYKHWVLRWLAEKMKKNKEANEESVKKISIIISLCIFHFFIKLIFTESTVYSFQSLNECCGNKGSSSCNIPETKEIETNLSPKDTPEEGQIEANKALKEKIGETKNKFENEDLSTKQIAAFKTTLKSAHKVAEDTMLTAAATGMGSLKITGNPEMAKETAKIAGIAQATISSYNEIKNFEENYEKNLKIEYEGNSDDKTKYKEEKKEND